MKKNIKYLGTLGIEVENGDTYGQYDRTEFLNKMPSIKTLEKSFKKSLVEKPIGGIWVIEVYVYEWDKELNETSELIEIIELKKYK